MFYYCLRLEHFKSVSRFGGRCESESHSEVNRPNGRKVNLCAGVLLPVFHIYVCGVLNLGLRDVRRSNIPPPGLCNFEKRAVLRTCSWATQSKMSWFPPPLGGCPPVFCWGSPAAQTHLLGTAAPRPFEFHGPSPLPSPSPLPGWWAGEGVRVQNHIIIGFRDRPDRQPTMSTVDSYQTIKHTSAAI